ncbi:uncharacterized protein LOC101213981 [Cucumis sativus]|uniref:Uncharacterized protein n=1 Tax=Cucumis sativus TaxID=3659 RepID=A0A0A0LVD6_CUCSA|nr:uncharacterized protein LOC101213981 [Cucumis sativus]KGN63966.1 hypothetical protein Csa_013194 [Cucumis sativus]
MSDPYSGAKGGRLTFKGGVLASRSKDIDKKKKKKKKDKSKTDENPTDDGEILTSADGVEDGDGAMYTIDAAKRMKYEELFPVETRKFGYDPNNSNTKFKSVEDALDDRVKKKADRYCK